MAGSNGHHDLTDLDELEELQMLAWLVQDYLERRRGVKRLDGTRWPWQYEAEGMGGRATFTLGQCLDAAMRQFKREVLRGEVPER
jgi:hypothetical protein